MDDHRLITATDLVELTRELVAVDSVSGAEAELADLVERRLRERACAMEVRRIGNNVVARTDEGHAARIVLAGHLDTVPLHELAGIRPDEEADRVHGRGAVDMKGGLAVMLRLADEVATMSYDATFVFYDQEEVGSRRSGMNRLFAEHRDLVQGDLAVLLEPTASGIEAGCQGNLVVEFTFHGVPAHTARPWQGRNAVHRAAAGLATASARRLPPVEIDGLQFRPSISVVGVEGGLQGNVVPDRCRMRVNFRHAPDIGSDAAVAELCALVPDADRIEVVLSSPPAAPMLATPLVRALRAAGDLGVRPKLGWTDVGRFAAHGIPAVNLGPGDSELAHGPDEVVDRDDLERCHATLRRFLHDPPVCAESAGR